MFLFVNLADYVNGGELFTHLYQREKFTEDEVRIYIGEIIIAIEHLHRVSKTFTQNSHPCNLRSNKTYWFEHAALSLYIVSIKCNSFRILFVILCSFCINFGRIFAVR